MTQNKIANNVQKVLGIVLACVTGPRSVHNLVYIVGGQMLVVGGPETRRARSTITYFLFNYVTAIYSLRIRKYTHHLFFLFELQHDIGEIHSVQIFCNRKWMDTQGES